MTTILDIHTHHLPVRKDTAIWNSMPGCFDLIPEVKYASAGLHPWYLQASTLDWQKTELERVVQLPQVVAIGEAGLDKTSLTPWSLQMEAFMFQAHLAQSLKLPLILHVVKAHNEMMQLKSELKPTNTWIVHGFRGKPQLAQQYIKEGFYLSIGALYNENSISSIPLDRLFFETDESETSIVQTYQSVAKNLLLPTDVLIDKVRQNTDKVFFNG